MTHDGAPVEATAGGRRGRPPVPLSRIVRTAVELVDEAGPDALTMRVLAQRLGTGTAVLYRAVSGRAELVGLMVDSVLGEGELEVPGDSGRPEWEVVCRAAATALFRTLSRHPGIAGLVIDQVPTGPNAMRLREGFLALLLHYGFAPEDAARVYATVSRFVLGFAAQMRPATVTAAEAAALRGEFGALDAQAFPATVAVADLLTGQTLEHEFEYGLELLIKGLATTRPA